MCFVVVVWQGGSLAGTIIKRKKKVMVCSFLLIVRGDLAVPFRRRLVSVALVFNALDATATSCLPKLFFGANSWRGFHVHVEDGASRVSLKSSTPSMMRP